MPDIKFLKLPSSEETFLQAQRVCSSRRRSCALVNTPTPCVKKALCHIQELKTKLENWGQKGGNAQHETENENNHSNIWKCVSIDGYDADVTTGLRIKGSGLCAEGDALTPHWKETVHVLAEVMCLMERLELDWRDAEKALLEEKEKAKNLLKKRDSLSHWRQQEFPIAMKKERDACCPEIAELTWQLKIRRDQQPQVRDRLTRTEVLNRRLNEDIDFMKKHGPLMEERLQTEEEIMKHIQTTENQTCQSLTNISQELKDLQLEFEAEQIRADTEKHNMNKAIKTLKMNLSDKLSELHQLQSQCEIFHRSIKKCKEKVTLKDSQIKALLQDIRQFERQQADQNDAVVTLKETIEDKERTFTQAKTQLLQLQTQIQITKGEGDEKISELNALLSHKRHDLLAQRAENQDHKLEIEDYKRKIWQSEQAVRQLQKDRERLMLRIRLNKEHRKQAKAELDQVYEDHSYTKDELNHLERLTYLEELRNRKQIEVMKIQITKEIKTLDTLKGDVAAAAAELNREHTQCERVKVELQIKFEDASSTAAQQEAKVKKLREIYTEKLKTIEGLKAKLSDVHAAHERLSDEFEKTKQEHQTHLNSVKDILHIVLLRSEKMSNMINELQLKSKELKKASDKMEETITNMPDIIENLKSLSDTAAFKHRTATVVMGNLRRDVISCDERKSRHGQVHSALLSQRQSAMKDMKANLQKALQDNLALAQEYTTQQKALMIARQDAVYVYDQRNTTEAYIHDHKQLSLLQKRMHKAMLKYFKRRSIYRQAELARFQALSNQNNQKMKALQSGETGSGSPAGEWSMKTRSFSSSSECEGQKERLYPKLCHSRASISSRRYDTEELSNAIYRLSGFLLAPTDDSTGSVLNTPGHMQPAVLI